MSGIEEQSIHLSRAAIEPRVYHPTGEISSTKIGIRIACVHIDRMSKVRGQQTKRTQSEELPRCAQATIIIAHNLSYEGPTARPSA